jgi:hypothetical protein
MTDAEAGTPHTAEDDETRAGDPPHDYDWFLFQLVEWANQFDIEQGITLAVGGAMISGQLISGRRYFEEVAAFLMSATGAAIEVKQR